VSTLCVCSVGGHLAELNDLAPRLYGVDTDRVWVTFDTPQSRSTLAGEDVIFVRFTDTRDIVGVAQNSLVARRLFRGRHPFSSVVSTGAAIALSFLPVGRMRGAACHYIESATRIEGPSATGRILSHVPGIALYAQYPGWALSPWSYVGSVFDGFVPESGQQTPRDIRRAVVTVGTMEGYEFRRLIDRARELLPRDAEVLWQVGCTDVSDLPLEARPRVPAKELEEAIAAADVVIAHAGCGSSLAALQAGKKAVLVPRLQARGENIDDHQVQLGEELSSRDLAIVRSVEDLRSEDLRLAAASSVRQGMNQSFSVRVARRCSSNTSQGWWASAARSLST